MAVKLDQTIVAQHSATLKKALTAIGKSGREARLSPVEVLYLMFLNQPVEERDYDVSPLLIDLEDLSWTRGDDGEKIREFAVMSFGSVFRRVAVRGGTKAIYKAALADRKKVALHVADAIEGRHFVWLRRQDQNEKEALRAGLNAVPVENRRENFHQALVAGTLGAILKGATDGRFLPWLQAQSPDCWHVAAEFGWNGDRSDFLWLIDHPECDRATAHELYLQFLGVGEHIGWQARFHGKPLDEIDPVLRRLLERWDGDGFAHGEIAYDFGLKQHYYRLGVEALENEGGGCDWMIDPAALEPRDGKTPDCPFYFGDWHAVFRSKADELAFPPDQLPKRVG